MDKAEKTTIKDIRSNLKLLSKKVEPLKKAGKIDTINEGIIKTIYTDDKNQEFKSFWSWKKEGKKIKKGSKAFPIWGKPRKAEKQNEESENDSYKFFPVAYLFSNNQVA